MKRSGKALAAQLEAANDGSASLATLDSIENCQVFLSQSQQYFPTTEIMPRTALYLVQLIASVIHKQSEQTAAEHGVHVTDLHILLLLQRAGPDHITPLSSLQKALSFTSGGMTRRLDQLGSLGLVERVANETDRRAWQVQLTPAGLALANKIRLDAKGWPSDPYKAIAEDEWTDLVDKLVKVRALFE